MSIGPTIIDVERVGGDIQYDVMVQTVNKTDIFDGEQKAKARVAVSRGLATTLTSALSGLRQGNIGGNLKMRSSEVVEDGIRDKKLITIAVRK